MGLALATTTAAALAAPPTVNGLFFGDGDVDRYSFLQNDTDTGTRGALYTAFEGTTVYFALVVDETVNDNVCVDKDLDATYKESAGWGNQGGGHDCAALIGSDHAAFGVECTGDGTNEFDWAQDLAYAEDGNDSSTTPGAENWLSDHLGADGSGTPPDAAGSFQSDSSTAYNLNNVDAGFSEWDVTLGGARTSSDDWKSPDAGDIDGTSLSGDNNDVSELNDQWRSNDFDGTDPGDDADGDGKIDGAGFLANNGDVYWEWPLVYEFKFDAAMAGCTAPIIINPGTAHNSPAKDEHGEDISFPPPEPLTDYGDAPDTYGTTETANGPAHAIRADSVLRIGDEIDAEEDGQPDEAVGDDNNNDDEDAVNPAALQEGDSTYMVTVENVTNTTGGDALLCGWIDFDDQGSFDTDASERACATVSDMSGNTDMNTDVDLTFTIPDDFDSSGGDDGQFFSRFRITTNWTTASDSSPTGTGAADSTDGEVEDHTIPISSLPVSLNAFSSRSAGGGLAVTWQTASETNNVGFEIWGEVDGNWRVLTDMVPSQAMNTAVPQRYSETISGGADITALALVDYDTRGRPERFGPFEPGQAYGEEQDIERIDWDRKRSQRQGRLKARGFVNTRGESAAQKSRGADKGQKADSRRSANAVVAGLRKRERFRKLAPQGNAKAQKGKGRATEVMSVNVGSGDDAEAINLHPGPLTHVEVTEAGIQRVSFEALREAGLDLSGARQKDIAVTRRGRPVARWIQGKGQQFGPGDWLEFIGRPPEGNDALHIDASLYQVSVDPSLARDAKNIGKGRARDVSDSYQVASMSDRPDLYVNQSPTGDPWVDELVRNFGSRTVTLSIPVDGPVTDGPASLVVELGTVSDLPDMTDADGSKVPEHNVEIGLSGPGLSSELVVANESIAGPRDWDIEAALPPGVLEAGTYTLRLTFETEYRYSLVVIDRYGVRYSTPYQGPTLDFAPDPEAQGYRVENVSSPAIVAYGEGTDGALTRIDPRVTRVGNGYAAELRQVEAERIWVDEDPHTPDVFTTAAPGDLLAKPADLVVIAESSFIGSEALEKYIQSKSTYSPVVVDLEDIYNSVGYGMALPEAINDYLKARNEIHPFTHVQLVGADCYDRLNYTSSCVSFVPLPTARVGQIIYSPSQNRLVDLDDDGVGDKAVAQFSVRDTAELETIVDKGSDWRSNVAPQETALLIAEGSDGRNDFLAQVERLNERLDWDGAEILSMADHPDISSARDALRDSLDAGQALTVFSGHSSPTTWAFPSLLTPASAQSLSNAGRPTMMVPLACETTFDISPNANVLGHQLMYAGDQGAVAISGAVSLSSLDDNERMANYILDGLKSGLTLGEAVQSGRDGLGTVFQTLHDNWITQGDVTVKLTP